MDAARDRLLAMRRELDSSVSTLEAEGAGTGSELSSADQHPADTATDLQDADRQVAVMEVAAEQRSQVNAALARVEDGTYGRCVDCGAELSVERLEARPEAARCVVCQARQEGEK